MPADLVRLLICDSDLSTGPHGGSQERPMYYLRANHRRPRGWLGPRTPQAPQTGSVHIPSATSQHAFLRTRAGASGPGMRLWLTFPFSLITIIFLGGGGGEMVPSLYSAI